jgi:hypothetical protein
MMISQKYQENDQERIGKDLEILVKKFGQIRVQIAKKARNMQDRGV